MKKAKITIQIVGWNSADVLVPGLRMLKQLPEDEVIIRYIDNNSSDTSVSLVEEVLPNADIIRLTKNVGFAGAHNIGLAKCDTEFVMTHDPDLEINLEGLSKILLAFKDSKLGAAQGKLLRSNEDIIDSVGIVGTLALNGQERGSNEVDKNQYNLEKELLAVTGASGVYRMSALRSISYSDIEFFDNDFFAYKEDVDLGWRLNNRGWKVKYIPVLQGVHARTLGRRGIFNWGINPVIVYNRLSDLRTRYSLRNWIWLIIKNITLRQFLKHGLFIFLRIFVFVIFSLCYWPLLIVWFEIVKGLPRMLSKRKSLSREEY